MLFHIIFITGLVLETVLKIITQTLNIQHLKNSISNPKRELKNIFKKQYLKKSSDYLKLKYRLSGIKNIFSLGFIFFLIYSGLFIKLSNIFNSLISLPLFSHLLFIGFLLFISYILFLPFSIIDTFHIEKQFGFSTITVKTFILDNIKVILLSVLLGGLLISGIFAFILKFQTTWWILAWGLFILFSLIMIKIFPTFIAPLFNKFTPVEDKKLKDKILKMTKQAKFSVSNIFKSNASKRSRHSNAYFTGIGKNKQIVLFDTLIKQLTPCEITGVLAHEIGHYKKGHIWKMFFIQTIITGLSIYLVKQLTYISEFLNAFNLNNVHYLAKFIFSLFFINSFFWLLQFPITALNRSHEFSADNFSSRITKKPQFLINSLIKLTKDNLSNPYPHPFYSTLYYSHPPLSERINKLKKDQSVPKS